MTLIPEIDEQASRDNARSLLKKYRQQARMAGRPLTDVKSPAITDMPKIPSIGNGIENKVVGIIDARNEVEMIDRGLAMLPCTSYWVLFYSYCNKEYLTYSEIAYRMEGYSVESIKGLKSKALLEFAEAYQGKRLLVFKNDSTISH